MIPRTVFPGWECPNVILLQFLYYSYVHSQLCSHNLQNMVHYNYLVLFSTLCCPLDAGFHLWENAVGELDHSQDSSFITGNEGHPALVLSNVHNRTSARDGPMFGSKGPSMNTSSLNVAPFQWLKRVAPSQWLKRVAPFQWLKRVAPSQNDHVWRRHLSEWRRGSRSNWT